ncbi:MAG: site-specific DNA-methyltransferase [Verrucomicrobia bacterium]|nr:site-specific DNA-methyltransferase [Verrucomicrobiota bacterium]
MTIPKNKILRGDCLKLLRTLPDECVDVCFADPPFNLEKKYGKYKDRLELDEYLAWCEAWITELVRVTKPTGSIFLHNLPKWLTYYAAILNRLAHFRHWISWDAMSMPLGKTLLPAHYGIIFYTKAARGYKFFEIRAPHKRCRLCNGFLKDYGGKKDQMHAFGNLVSDVWTDIHRIKHNKRRDEHPCQLPVHLLERVILMSTDPGDVVLDPFLGTGTTAIAAKALGRHYIGMELDETYVRIAKQKLKRVTRSKHKGFFVSYFLNKLQSVRDIDARQIFPAQLTKQQKRQREQLLETVQPTELEFAFEAEPVARRTNKLQVETRPPANPV